MAVLAYALGRCAAGAGRPESDNPYRQETDAMNHNWWLSGHRDATLERSVTHHTSCPAHPDHRLYQGACDCGSPAEVVPNEWIAVDLDGTLAYFDEWRGLDHIGVPLMPMVERVKAWIAAGKDVRIFTARVGGPPHANARARVAIERWCEEHIGAVLPVTATKDYGLRELWDDRCIQMIPNTGLSIGDPEAFETSALKGKP